MTFCSRIIMILLMVKCPVRKISGVTIQRSTESGRYCSRVACWDSYIGAWKMFRGR